ncbi:MAG: lamin tail domain-containing protein [Saprospiraceae bacterium]|nr:lamin tail domain-containing protein [Saprospiraceae bacterium]
MPHSIIRFVLFLSLIVYSDRISAQLVDDFSDGDFTNGPSWTGDTDDFVVNINGELQLMAPEAGESSLFTTLSYPDTIQLDMTFRLEMSPSSSNFGLIYLGLDDIDPSVANGYYLQIGESGSNDAIKLYRLDSGSEILLATASDGAISSDPAQARISVTIYPDGLWSFSTDYDLSGFNELEFEVMDDTHSFSGLNIFGVYCEYTETRKENFFYDDISIMKFEQDEIGPLLTNLSVTGDKTILLSFNEKIDATTAENLDNYIVDQGLGSPSGAISDGVKVFLTFDNIFLSGTPYQLAILNVEDENGNAIIPIAEPFIVTVFPNIGDLAISEILSDPYSGGTDFVEIYNKSDNFINLNGLIISNINKEEEKKIDQDIELLPDEYICFTEDKEFLISTYPTHDVDQIIEVDLPSFNNDSGNVSLSHSSASTDYIDQFDYDEGLHFELLDDTEGVSLERISFTADTQSEDNWHSASTTAGLATPGIANSNSLPTEVTDGEFELVEKVFSPNSDGDNDFLIINYKLDKPGYVANVKVFDDEGFEIDQIVSNGLLATEGLITWNGTTSEGSISQIGLYIIIAELFHPDGEIKNFKKVCVLADFIK